MLVLEYKATEENKMSIETKLIERGGKLWETGSMKRIYINNISELCGFDYTRYNTGNVSDASYNGEKISNTKATEILNNKIFFDCNTQKFSYPKYDFVEEIGIYKDVIETLLK